MTMKMASSPRHSTPGWISFRNVLLFLIAMQITVLIAIGFSAPNDNSLEDLLLKPAEHALEGFLASLKETSPFTTRQTTRSLDDSLKLLEILSDEWEQVGPHDIAGAFTNNFIPERRHPSFRQAMPSVQDIDKAVEESLEKVSQLVPNKTLLPCQYHQMHGDTVRVFKHEECKRPNAGEIVAYNTMPFERTWCGKSIQPHSIETYNEVCDDPVSLWNVKMPQANVRGLPKIKLLRKGLDDKPKQIDCNLPCLATVDTCESGEGEDCLPEVSEWTVDGTDMTFTYSMLTPSQDRNLLVDPKAYRNGKHFATRSFESEIPLSYFSWEKYGTPTPPVDYDAAEKATSFFKSKHCIGAIRADVWANFTAHTTRLVSYGSCYHNTDVPEDMSLDDEEDRQALLEKYLFHLVIDDTQDDDFVDEAVWEALRAGVIPVYFGAANIKDHVPPNSIISAADYKTKVATAERINEVANNRQLWESYHEWRKHSFPKELKAKYQFLKTSPLCRMCRWSYAKKYGLAWDHERQNVDVKAIGGRMCFTKRGALKFPFGETWMTPTVARPPGGSCNWKLPHNTTIIATDMNVNRTVEQHDGIVDMSVNQLVHAEEVVVLKLQFYTIENDGGSYFSNIHQMVPSGRTALMTSIAIQDEGSRVIVLCDWPTKAYSPSPGIIQIEVLSNGEKELMKDETRLLRVIPEDLDQLRDDSTEFSLSPYSRRMIEDFLNPLELFLVES